MTTRKTLVWYWYHITAMSGTTTPLRLVPQKCYSGTERVILSSYEKEHRTIKVNSPGLHKINKEALVEIIFGCRTSTEDKNEIRRLVEQNEFNDVQFSETKVNPNAYKLDIIPCDFS